MSQGVSRRKPPVAGNDTVRDAPQTRRLPPTSGGALAEQRLRAGGDYRRIDEGSHEPAALHSGAAVDLRARRDIGTADVAESLEQFVYRHGQYFDSYLATEPGRCLFWSRKQRGLISYACRGRHVLVGGGLIAPESHKEELLGEFLEHASRRRLHIAFHNMSDDDAPLFRRFGFQITKWGEEPLVDLGDCTWGGKSFEWVRRQTNYCLRNGLAAREVRREDLEPRQWARTLAEVLEVAAESHSIKPQAEDMKFFEGRIDNHDLGLRRLFVARSEGGAGRMEGFIICNPMRDGSMWATEMYRHRLDSVRGTVAFLMHHILQQLQAEGVEHVGMCLDPGFRCETPLPGDSALVRHGLQFAERHLSYIFDVAGLRHFKSRFRPRYESRYVFSRPKISVGSVISFLRVFGLLNLSYGKLARIIVDRVRKRASRKTLADVSGREEVARLPVASD